jgi:hypothetical protein
MAALLFATVISDEVWGSRKSIRRIVGGELPRDDENRA